MKKLYLLIVIGSLLLSCSAERESENLLHVPQSVGIQMNEDPGRESSTGGIDDVSKDNSPVTGSTKEIIPDKIIKTADISIEVTNYQGSMQNIKEIVSKNGAYLSNENESTDLYKINNILQIRIPNKNFDTCIIEIVKLARKVDRKVVTSQDVTEEYVDIEARLKTKREVLARYYQILKQAKNIEGILKVEEKIKGVREEIEAAEGRLMYLDSRVAYSIINLNIYQALDYEYMPESEPGFFQRSLKALDMGWSGVLNFIISVLYLWPLWIVLGILVIIFLRIRKSKSSRI